jgi:glycosyltransferase involved in cell wall biosynthesis
MNPRLLGLTYGTLEPASRFRFVQYIPGLTARGWEVVHRPCTPPRPWRPRFRPPLVTRVFAAWVRHRHVQQRTRDLSDADAFQAVFVNRDILHGDTRWEAALSRRNPNWIFDLDDNLFAGAAPAHAEYACRNAAWVVAGNNHLAGLASAFTDRVSVIPTCVELEGCSTRRPTPPPGTPFRIGWCGSEGSIHDTLEPFLPVLAHLRPTLEVELVVISDVKPRWRQPGLRWSFIPWSPGIERRLGDWMDCGIMPLRDTAFQRGKCGLKLLLYHACALPVIASPVGANRDIVAPGRNGFLADTPAEWHASINQLLASPDLARRLGDEGRRQCESAYSLQIGLERLASLLNRLASVPHR